MIAAAAMDSDFDSDLETEPIPSKKQSTTASKSSKKTTESKRGEQDPVATGTEYKKASHHPDVLQVSARGKRAATEAPHEPGTSSPKKVCLHNEER